MKNNNMRTLLGAAALVISGLSASPAAHAQCVSGLGATAYQVASNDWSTAPGTTIDMTLPLSFVAGNQLASDGATVFMLNSQDHHVYEVNVNTSSMTKASNPIFVDLVEITNPNQYSQMQVVGGRLYVFGNGGLHALLPSGHTFSAGLDLPGPLSGMAFDGQYLWISLPGILAAVNPSTSTSPVPTLHASYRLGSTAPGPLLFDGQNLWMETGGALVKMDRSTGAMGQKVGGVTGPVLFDGSFLWFAAGTNTLSKYDPGTSSQTLVPVNSLATGLLGFDGTTIWMQASAAAGRIRACDGSNRGAIALPGTPASEVFDGVRHWITYQDNSMISVR